MKLGRFAALVVCILSAVTVLSQTAPPPDLDTWVAQSMKGFNVPGLSLAIVKDGKVVVVKGYGVRKLGESVPVDEDTAFAIGSNTKAFTTACLAMLVDEGKITWDDPVYQRLPGFVMYDPYVSHEITIRDLLTHRSGMGLGEGDLLFFPRTTYTRTEVIHQLRYMKPASSFRSRFAYDNLLYLAAGQIIPAVTGTSWDDFVQQRILARLGMNNSNTSVTAFKSGGNFAFPHTVVDGKLQVVDFMNLDNAAPGGSINSSAADMAKWVIVQLNRGKLPDSDTRLFSEKQSEEMWTPQTILPIPEPPAPLAALKANFGDYGLGWMMRDYQGRKLILHSGGVIGYVSRVALVPQEKLGVVILTNAMEGGAFDSLLFMILDHYLKVPHTDWVAAYKSTNDMRQKEAAAFEQQQSLARNKTSHPSLPQEKYAGTYQDAWYGVVNIRMESGHLVLNSAHSPALAGELEHWQYDTFRTHWGDHTVPDAFVTFSLKADGSIDRFTMQPMSPLADFSFDYRDLEFHPVPAEKR
jgi:CubicO group peptidase (beta-lactamase class C family)